MGLCLPALATPAAPVRVLVSLGEMSSAKDMAWRKEACARIHKLGNQMVSQGLQVTCRNFEPLHAIDTYLQQLKHGQSFHVRLVKGFRNSYRLDITNWNRTFASDFNVVSWNINDAEKALQEVMANFFNFIQTEQNLKTQWLLSVLPTTDVVSYDYKNLSFVERKGRKRVSTVAALRLFEQESSANAKYLQARAELAILFSTLIPDDSQFLKPDSTLEAALIKAGRVAQAKNKYWRRWVRADHRTGSALTSFIMESNDQDARDWQGLSAILGTAGAFEVPPQSSLPLDIRKPAPALSSKTTSPAAKLIYLF